MEVGFGEGVFLEETGRGRVLVEGFGGWEGCGSICVEIVVLEFEGAFVIYRLFLNLELFG